jgi:hypothetical protein
LNIIDSKDIEDRAHVLVLQSSVDSQASYIVANVYAPNPNTRDKIDFFQKVLDQIFEYEETYDCQNVMLLGDLNLIFKNSEGKNRLFSTQERKTSKAVKDLLDSANLTDAWKNNCNFTWRRPGTETFSCLDRIFYKLDALKLLKASTNWTLSFSDHAAVEMSFSKIKNGSKGQRSKITRLDPSLLKSELYKNKIMEELGALMRQAPTHWNPHMRLEYLKMSIRTVCEKAQADRKKVEKSEEDYLNEELELCIEALADPLTTDRDKPSLIDHIEDLRARKSILVEEKGARLAEKLGTNWYNEGEKSTRYFLRLLNRSSPDNFTSLLNNEGETITDSTKIEDEIANFYRCLYESYDKSNLVVDDDVNFFNKILPVPENEAQPISEPISENELWSILKTCKDSAPGPDGITYSHIKHLWPIAGKIILDSWNFSLTTGTMPESHRTSFLKLIPKAGKDLKKLTNWRPITLSNCDHKLITKCYSKRLCDALSNIIDQRQTAYIKSRVINDNIRTIIGAIKAANLDPDIDGLVVSLDAKKAFDSVEHQYIETCLEKFGMGNFVPIFRTLYKDLYTDIIINGRIKKGFKINRGVKQGDALSCILFIICMEPLIRNIQSNPLIVPVTSNTLNFTFPKAQCYADDLNPIIKNCEISLAEVFSEYERLTRKSGLELNADKTELLRLSRNTNLDKIYEVRYMHKTHKIPLMKETKINGILFQMNEADMKNANVDSCIAKIDRQLRGWSMRNLSILGKVLILKTFGVSNIIYLLQSMCLNESHFKRFNSTLYKFIWNRHYLAAKAPERIKREFVNTPVKYGGFGMLDLVKLDNSLKLRALGRTLISRHPFLNKISETINLSDFFFPTIKSSLDEITMQGINLLRSTRQDLWTKHDELRSEAVYVKSMKDIRISTIISQTGKTSLPYFRLRISNKSIVGDLTINEVNSIERFVANKTLLNSIKDIVRFRNVNPNVEYKYNLTFNKKWCNLLTLSSKQIREVISLPLPICIFKVGVILSPAETLNYFTKLNKITCTSHKSLMLKVLHGDIYTNDKLCRYGLRQDPICNDCTEIDTLEHRLLNCRHTAELINLTIEATKKLSRLDSTSVDYSSIDPIQQVLGIHQYANESLITIHAELLKVIMYRKAPLLNPQNIIQNILKSIIVKERNNKIKERIKSLLESL